MKPCCSIQLMGWVCCKFLAEICQITWRGSWETTDSSLAIYVLKDGGRRPY